MASLKGVKKGFSKKHCEDKGSLCDGVWAAMVGSRVSRGEGGLAVLSSWFCVCAGWWRKLTSLHCIVEPHTVQGSILGWGYELLLDEKG